MNKRKIFKIVWFVFAGLLFIGKIIPYFVPNGIGILNTICNVFSFNVPIPAIGLPFCFVVIWTAIGGLIYMLLNRGH